MKAECPVATPHRAIRALLKSVCLCAMCVTLAVPALGQANYATPYTFTTLAGNTGYGSVDGVQSTARFWNPLAVAADGAGNLYVADSTNNTIRKVTPRGIVTTLAGLAGNPGAADGTGSAARFNCPIGLALDGAGNVYVADSVNNTIRMVTPGGVVTSLAGLAGSSGTNDGTGNAARFNAPWGVAVDGAGNLYVADRNNYTIRKITQTGTNWVVATLAGQPGKFGSMNGSANTAQFGYPEGLAVDGATNVYVADSDSGMIRKVTLAGAVSTLAQGFFAPGGVTVDSAGNVYVADTMHAAICEVTPSGIVTIMAVGFGSADGTNGIAGFNAPYGVPVDSTGNVYVADTGNNTIRKIAPIGLDWGVTTLAGLAGGVGSADGTNGAARLDAPCGVAVDGMGNVFVGDSSNNIVRQVTPEGVVTTLAGLAGTQGSADGTNSTAQFYFPGGVAVDTADNVYVADEENNTIRQVTPQGVVTTLAGLARNRGNADGTGSAARFSNPSGVAVDSSGNVYVADTDNDSIRQLTPSGTNWVVTTIAGIPGSQGSADGTNSTARFRFPTGVAVDGAGNIYVADYYNDTIRRLTPMGTNWVVTTLAGLAGNPGSTDGTGSAARFYWPEGVAVDSTGNVYVADTWNCRIREITPTGIVTTLAGLASASIGFGVNGGYGDGTGTAALFNYPIAIAVDGAGNIYVADSNNNTIRRGFPVGSVPSPSLQPPSLSASQFGFGITGFSGLAVDVQTSPDLSNWQVAGTSILDGGSNYFVSPTTTQGAQFYRVHVR